MSKMKKITRRTALKATAGAVGAATLPLVHMRTSHAARQLKSGIWDHRLQQDNPRKKGRPTGRWR